MLVVVGGHSRNIGKTSVVASIIAATRALSWQAIKITQHGHGVCSNDGLACDCAGDPTHPYALDEQREADGTDSGRYLGAGAMRSWWLRTAQGDLGEAMPVFRKLLAEAQNTIVESNSILRFVQPDAYVVVLDCAVSDIKDSSRLFMDRADAFAIVRRDVATIPWPVPERWIRSKPAFPVEAPTYANAELVHFVTGLQRR